MVMFHSTVRATRSVDVTKQTCCATKLCFEISCIIYSKYVMRLSHTDENTDHNMEIISKQQNNFNQHNYTNQLNVM